ncbi:MAG: type II toxin-antitoxin system VapC family toxin [Rhodoglobus sp.]
MRVLLDTHILLWWLSDNDRLGTSLRSLITSGHNEIFVSAVSIAEIAIKRSQGKLVAPSELLNVLTEEGFQELPLLSVHSAEVEALPWHHRDPFDRLLIAQARVENLTFATHDARIRDYDVSVISD